MPVALSVIAAFLIMIAAALGLWGCPQWQVYSQRLQGEAELARADFNRQVAVREAQAKKDAAALLADAEVIRAGGVAKANAIIGDSLKGNEAYLKYLWITDVAGNNRSPTVIYVPTEANIPMLEAGKRQ
jgi:regulator of protease activity HflC (stomatin/prohibitin superfamily)